MQASETVEKGKRAQRLSKDGLWRSFPKVPCLLQYVRTGTYYARVRVNGKLIRRSLETDVWSDAKLKLADAAKDYRQPKQEKPSLTVGAGWDLFLHAIAHDISIKESSRKYKHWCLQKLERSWPNLKERHLSGVTVQECREWADKLRSEIAGQYCANVIATLRQIFTLSIKEQVRQGGNLIENPVKEVARPKIPQKDLRLPEPDQFKKLV